MLVRNWGRIGTNGREKVEEFATEAGAVLEQLAQAKRRRGTGIYEDNPPSEMAPSKNLVEQRETLIFCSLIGFTGRA